jgi:hypothetical protein
VQHHVIVSADFSKPFVLLLFFSVTGNLEVLITTGCGEVRFGVKKLLTYRISYDFNGIKCCALFCGTNHCVVI